MFWKGRITSTPARKALYEPGSSRARMWGVWRGVRFHGDTLPPLPALRHLPGTLPMFEVRADSGGQELLGMRRSGSDSRRRPGFVRTRRRPCGKTCSEFGRSLCRSSVGGGRGGWSDCRRRSRSSSSLVSERKPRGGRVDRSHSRSRARGPSDRKIFSATLIPCLVEVFPLNA